MDLGVYQTQTDAIIYNTMDQFSIAERNLPINSHLSCIVILNGRIYKGWQCIVSPCSTLFIYFITHLIGYNHSPIGNLQSKPPDIHKATYCLYFYLFSSTLTPEWMTGYLFKPLGVKFTPKGSLFKLKLRIQREIKSIITPNQLQLSYSLWSIYFKKLTSKRCGDKCRCRYRMWILTAMNMRMRGQSSLSSLV